uniref:Uncharacterized protein n=1 Tax=Arundo donax TaxID=35708 RepID=A0A0A9DI90_ARUDO
MVDDFGWKALTCRQCTRDYFDPSSPQTQRLELLSPRRQRQSGTDGEPARQAPRPPSPA